MCGIVGYVGTRAATELLLAGLQKLEYRGYDSAGVSVVGDDGQVDSVRAVGNLANLRGALAAVVPDPDGGVATLAPPATAGIGHTRWATHGRVNEANAHPHFDTDERVHVVVNGIVENYLALKERLLAEGAVFTSQTDAEVIAHLVARHYEGDLVAAVRGAYAELEGHFAFVALTADEPDVLVGARRECPLVVGRGDGEQFVASAIPAFLAQTRHVQIVENEEIVVVRREGVELLTPDGQPIERAVTEVDWDEETAEKGGFETFMLKEIHEQGDALADTIVDRTARHDGVDLHHETDFDEALLHGVERVVILACGTSYHAGVVGRYVLEEWARLPVETDIASEYRYRNPILGPGDLVVGITQSGETADTLAAMRLARARGARVIAITNAMGSQATREADGVLYTRAGLEIGVAATKTFVCQVAVVQLLALRLAELRGTLSPERRAALVADLRAIPGAIDGLLRDLGESVERIAGRHARDSFFLYLGRHVGLPIALEGALKLKEISYIATDAYAAGEMKHGPIALLDERTPVITVATDSPVLDKVVSNMQEVRARGAHVIAVATEGNVSIGEHAEEVLRIPRTDPLLQPILAVLPLQLLAYAIARHRGLNVDQPRNLAKTVTVE
ncbi:MAG: glutamine--fructose-6-phosphate transaminase (isomerizing) [Actinomycetota bacterium]|nr:glutamine--fructose-6-phosphate transaminase (isomerizing) [Actinomycetota bacterium]